ncbi:hypothetical protein FA13DRAFT_196689 [Coprinellus micaceus]|uniref:Uncharacterized protein n=1 Tax=Coprinellus micaceus TaxID=71717 RepID=A0A4Y7TI61_COPMI|nr:hypothetical protein FA13DRAFT_196689 [Coprinellus micaceus]
MSNCSSSVFTMKVAVRSLADSPLAKNASWSQHSSILPSGSDFQLIRFPFGETGIFNIGDRLNDPSRDSLLLIRVLTDLVLGRVCSVDSNLLIAAGMMAECAAASANPRKESQCTHFLAISKPRVMILSYSTPRQAMLLHSSGDGHIALSS